MARTRRPAPEARAHIVSVAREQVLDKGPSALRLKEVAEAAGVSHPTVLHHFGSREGLIRAVVDDAMGRLDDELEEILSTSTELDPSPIVDAMTRVMTDGGYARLIAWLALSSTDGSIPGGRVSQVIDAVHAARLRLAPKDTPPPTVEDSAFLSMLVTYAMVGEAIIGPGMRRNCGLDVPNARSEFRKGLVDLVRRWVLGQ